MPPRTTAATFRILSMPKFSALCPARLRAVARMLLCLGVFAFGCSRLGAQTVLTDDAGATATIRPGDQISLRILREPEMGGVFTVADDGRVLLPRLGSIRVDDRSATALRDSLASAYAEFLRDPSLEVTVLRRIGVRGEVQKPDLYLVDLTLTLRDVIAQAGGVTENGDRNKIEIVRDGERIDLGDGDQAQYLASQLRSGDQIVVGRRSWLANPAVAIPTLTALGTFLAVYLIPLIR